MFNKARQGALNSSAPDVSFSLQAHAREGRRVPQRAAFGAGGGRLAAPIYIEGARLSAWKPSGQCFFCYPSAPPVHI